MSIRTFGKSKVIAGGVVPLLCFLLTGAGNVMASAQATLTQTPPAQTTAQTPPATGAAKPAAVKLTADQLDSLVAPIALYPDPLLSQALVASTYPLELVQAQQWLEKNKSLKGDALTKEVEKQKWDPSVQATVVVPDLLKRLTEDITWTDNLGNAFLDQQADVMDAAQRLRKKAKDAGKLESTEQQKVETKVVETKTVIEIQPTSTTVVYVPTYSPTVIWGPPLYYPYPPIYYPPYYPGSAWLGFGVGIMVGIGISGGWGYGCGWGGGGNNVYINHNNNFIKTNNIRTGNINNGNINGGRSDWNHNPSHRGAAPYANQNTASKFGGTARGDSPSARTTGAGNGGANRPSTGATGANRPSSSSAGGAGGDKVGSRSVPQSSSRSGSGFSGTSSGASRAGSTSSRGGSSMGSRGGGGGGRR
jgi:hypothetical protein